MKYILSLVPYVEISPAAYRFLKREYDWLLSGRSEEIAEELDGLWYALNEQDMQFMNARGKLMDEKSFKWLGGNGFQYAMLDAVPELE